MFSGRTLLNLFKIAVRSRFTHVSPALLMRDEEGANPFWLDGESQCIDQSKQCLSQQWHVNSLSCLYTGAAVTQCCHMAGEQ